MFRNYWAMAKEIFSTRLGGFLLLGLSCAISITITLLLFNAYLERNLDGDINNHILAGEMFGMPEEVKSHGINPFFYGPNNTGWDGQFYYYMSNDLFAQKDTASHIDSPSYRYQRIGLSLFVSLLSKFLGNDFIYPSLYFKIYLALIFFSTIIGSLILKKVGANPFLIILWSLSVGTQLTLFNALPDAAADGFLIIALFFIQRDKRLSAILLTFSALSREVYILFPISVFIVCLLENCRTKKQLLNDNLIYLIFPILIPVAWRWWLIHHFGVSPQSQATGVLGLPFYDWYKFVVLGLQGKFGVVGDSRFSEGLSLIVYMSLILMSFYLILIKYKILDIEYRGIYFALIFLGLIYISFGPTVLSHYTGYSKPIAIYYFLLPLLIYKVDLKNAPKYTFLIFIIIGFSFSNYYNLTERIFGDRKPLAGRYFDSYTKMKQVSFDKNIECLLGNSVDIKILKINYLKNNLLFEININNTGNEDLLSTKRAGGIYASYVWMNEAKEVVQDGVRSAINDPIKPGESRTMVIVSKIPKSDNQLFFVPTLVQEGCSWFYWYKPIDPYIIN
jgi:hypothetical protein